MSEMVKDTAGLAVENGASRSCARTRSEGLDGIRCRAGTCGAGVGIQLGSLCRGKAWDERGL